MGIISSKIMARYEYTDGERRYYKGVIIFYDKKGVIGHRHWYIRLTTNLQDALGGHKFRPQISRKYFDTLTEAKGWIDNLDEY